MKQAEEAQFVDLIACERDCRTAATPPPWTVTATAASAPTTRYCPCVNPVVARSKTALRLIELRPILLQDLRVRALVDATSTRDLAERIRSTSGRL